MDNSSNTGLPEDSQLRQAPTINKDRILLYPGQVINERYQILQKVGRGAMGEVWRAFDLKLRMDIALKSLRSSTPNSLEALRREVRISREVISPNVCRIFDLVVEQDQEYLSMEYIDGQTLLALLREKSPLQLNEAREIALQFLSGLESIHQAGLIHRDLKPENIMITRTGRVVVMDFGIAKFVSQTSGTIAGTFPYMAAEQLSGSKIDRRADVFASGIVLAEMINTVHNRQQREVIWNLIRDFPLKLADNPWQKVIARAVARNPEDRFASAQALARALEEVTQRLSPGSEKKPYPGLASFSEKDAGYFFGRELELETVLAKIQKLHLMAMIGPSGAGKTSFLQAGLIPALPKGWSNIFAQPGDTPLVNLGQALAPEFIGDAEAIQKMVRVQDPQVAMWLLQRWRKNHNQALIIVDRFEELFTLNDHKTQSRFAELLGRAVLEGDIRVLLCMRDDFLIFCNDHSFLAPIFSELTALSPLSGACLRRALIQPALQCGYRFEDEALIDEILIDVEKERGALPLLAFATSQLWERRDHQAGLLRRSSYQEIGGVAGALAQHAEATMEKICPDGLPIAREIFRNLITAQKTRAARDYEELLSIFSNRDEAENILRTLINARLLTSFEASQKYDDRPRRRVEIIHESLQFAWPRLIRWQTQDADYAQFRDQLRQAANVWEERGHAIDLLWTGTSYKEFEVWRERYSGGLTGTENAFADAMSQQVQKQRLKRRVIVSTTFIVLLLILGIIAGLWKNEKGARQQAVSQARRADSSRLLALGKAELDHDPTLALAYAIASLERADTEIGRHFAMQALWKGPIAFVIPNLIAVSSFVSFSPDGKWFAVGGYMGVYLLERGEQKPEILEDGLGKIQKSRQPQFSADSKYLVWTSGYDQSLVRVWSIAEGKEVRNFKFEGVTTPLIRGSRLIMFTKLSSTIGRTFLWDKLRIRVWGFDQNDPKIIGKWDRETVDPESHERDHEWATTAFDVSNDGHLLAYGIERNIYTRPLEGMEDAPKTLIGTHQHRVAKIMFHLDGKQIASADSTGEIRIWSLSQMSQNPIRTFAARGPVFNPYWEPLGHPFFSPSGSLLAVTFLDRITRLWDMNGPPDSEPLILKRGTLPPPRPYIAFHPSGRVAALGSEYSIDFWPMNSVYPYVLPNTGDNAADVRFTDDGKQLISVFLGGDQNIRFWDMNNLQKPALTLKRKSNLLAFRIDVDPSGKLIAIATGRAGPVVFLNPEGTERQLPGGIGAGFVSFSPDSRTLAAESYGDLLLWDLKKDHVRRITMDKTMSIMRAVQFSSDGTLFTSHSNGNVYHWNLKNGTQKMIMKGNGVPGSILVTKMAPYLVVSLWIIDQGDLQKQRSDLKIYDLRTGKLSTITTHGNRLNAVSVDLSGLLLVTGDLDGVVRAGPITGEEPHLMFGHQGVIANVAVSPDRLWIASAELDNPVIRLWPMPKGKPLHTLPYEIFLKKLRDQTNARVVEDQKSSIGYRITFDRFPGWETFPTW